MYAWDGGGGRRGEGGGGTDYLGVKAHTHKVNILYEMLDNQGLVYALPGTQTVSQGSLFLYCKINTISNSLMAIDGN